MARWDDLHRAIAARDTEGAERIWLELLESDLDSMDRFLDAARTMAAQSGGKRQAGILLWMLAETLKEKERGRDLIRVYAALSRTAPDDGTVRQGLIDASRATFGDRPDLDDLLEKSGVVGGAGPQLAEQAERLESFLRLEPGAYVYHRGGWGVGRIVRYLPDRGRCVIDFHDRSGHEMDIVAAADRLERLDPKDIRAVALSDPKRLRKWASEEPLEMIRQVLGRFNGSAKLRHVKDALVPDAVAPTRWSEWWKQARKLAHLDPRYHVGGGRDPVLEYHDTAAVDFRTQVERSFQSCGTVPARQKVAREFALTAAGDPEAQATLAELVRAERDQAKTVAQRIPWDLVLAGLEGAGERDALVRAVAEAPDAKALLLALPDEDIRGAAARVLVESAENGVETLYGAILEQDDPVLANVGVDRFASAGRPEYLPRLLDHVDAKPALHPNLYAWYVRGLRRDRWEGRSYDPYALVGRVLKVLDAVEYRCRRAGTERDRAGVQALADLLTSKNGELVRAAAEATDQRGANHLLRVLEQNRGIKGRTLQKVQAIILRIRPTALRETARTVDPDAELAVGDRLDRIYMTPDGIAKLKAARDHIVNEEMPENSKEIARAREFGDLSENAEYHAARERQSLLQARADSMSAELARAVPITADIVRTDAVSVGTRVHLKDLEGHDITYTLLGPPDADVKQGILNYLTPLGQALMGRKPGDHVQVTFEEGSRDLVILSIEPAL